MNQNGLTLCARFAYPPNSLSLCGPTSYKDLKWYTSSGKIDKGASEILTQFTTLFPYLNLIAYENNIRDPFEKEVVEAYWLGNKLLNNVTVKKLINFAGESLALKKKLNKKKLTTIFQNMENGGIPYHAYHVLNIYKRTGHTQSDHTIETMDACIINWGEIIKINPYSLLVETRPLTVVGHKLARGKPILRKIIAQGKKDFLFNTLKIGDFISYHWGYFCQKLNKVQLTNLRFYTDLSINSANRIL